MQSEYASVNGTIFQLAGPWTVDPIWGSTFEVGDPSRAVDPAKTHFSTNRAGGGEVWVDVHLGGHRIVDSSFSVAGGTVRVVAGEMALADQSIIDPETEQAMPASKLFSYAYWSDGSFEVATGQMGRAETNEILNRFSELQIETSRSGVAVDIKNRGRRGSARSVHRVGTSALVPENGSMDFEDRNSSRRLPVPGWAGRKTNVGEVWSLRDESRTLPEVGGLDPTFQDDAVLLVNSQLSAIVTPAGTLSAVDFVESIEKLEAVRR